MSLWVIAILLFLLLLVGIALFGVKVAHLVNYGDPKEEDEEEVPLPDLQWWQYRGSDLVICLADNNEWIHQLSKWYWYRYVSSAKDAHTTASPALATHLNFLKAEIEANEHGHLNGNYVHSWAVDSNGWVLTTRMWPDPWHQGKPSKNGHHWYYTQMTEDRPGLPPIVLRWPWMLKLIASWKRSPRKKTWCGNPTRRRSHESLPQGYG